MVGIALCELSLRVSGLATERERARSVFDPRYGEVPRDSWIWSFDLDPKRHAAVLLRGQLIPLRKPAGEKRVLFLGDSATAGAFLPDEQAFPERFGALVRARDPSVRVINAGVWGMTTVDEYHLLRDKLLPLSPDFVVLCVFMANDLNWNLAHRERRPADDLWDTLRTRSALLSFAFRQLGALRVQDGAPALLPLPARVRDERGLRMLSYPEGELATYLRPPSRLTQHAFAVLRGLLQDFLALGARHGFTLRVLLVPSPSRVLGRLAVLHYPRLLAELAEQGVKIAAADVDVDQPTERVLSICDDLELACVDATAQLRPLGLAAFVPGDEHPSRKGHEALARALMSH